MQWIVALFPAMFVKHFWTAIYTPRGKFLGGLAARILALYEAFFYAVLLTAPLGPLFVPAVLMAVIHWFGVALYFRGVFSRYSKLALPYAVFEAVELAFLLAAALWLV